jgi:hypothetical protein
MNPASCIETVRQVIDLLVGKKYSQLESITKGIRLSAQDMESAIAAHRRKLIMPPSDAYKLMNAVRVGNSEPQKWSVVMPLWTQEEGRSDLSIELTLTKINGGFAIELDDIHVL